MRGSTWVKICGVTLPQDIELLSSAGVDAVGLNFVPRSKRRIDPEKARELSAMARGRLERVGVVEDLDARQIRDLIDFVGLDRVQLHGNEPRELVEALGSKAYKAVGVASRSDVELAATLPGEVLLVDAKLDGLVGGTGRTFDWQLVTALCRSRCVIVAGGIGPHNVGRAVRELQPYGIDVASGVERPGSPGVKDRELVLELMRTIRDAEQSDAR